MILKAGDQLQCEMRESEFPGWFWCTNKAGTSAWVPISWCQISGDSYIVKRDYNSFELHTYTGDLLIASLIESGWIWAVNENGQSGWVPLDTLDAIEV